MKNLSNTSIIPSFRFVKVFPSSENFNGSDEILPSELEEEKQNLQDLKKDVGKTADTKKEKSVDDYAQPIKGAETDAEGSWEDNFSVAVGLNSTRISAPWKLSPSSGPADLLGSDKIGREGSMEIFNLVIDRLDPALADYLKNNPDKLEKYQDILWEISNVNFKEKYYDAYVSEYAELQSRLKEAKANADIREIDKIIGDINSFFQRKEQEDGGRTDVNVRRLVETVYAMNNFDPEGTQSSKDFLNKIMAQYSDVFALFADDPEVKNVIMGLFAQKLAKNFTKFNENVDLGNWADLYVAKIFVERIGKNAGAANRASYEIVRFIESLVDPVGALFSFDYSGGFTSEDGRLEFNAKGSVMYEPELQNGGLNVRLEKVAALNAVLGAVYNFYRGNNVKLGVGATIKMAQTVPLSSESNAVAPRYTIPGAKRPGSADVMIANLAETPTFVALPGLSLIKMHYANDEYTFSVDADFTLYPTASAKFLFSDYIPMMLGTQKDIVKQAEKEYGISASDSPWNMPAVFRTQIFQKGVFGFDALYVRGGVVLSVSEAMLRSKERGFGTAFGESIKQVSLEMGYDVEKYDSDVFLNAALNNMSFDDSNFNAGINRRINNGVITFEIFHNRFGAQQTGVGASLRYNLGQE